MTRPVLLRFASVILTAVALATSIPLQSQARDAKVLLHLTGDVTTPLALTEADFKALPRAKAEVLADQRTVIYEGVALAHLLERAGAPLGAALRGDALTSYMVATASDGYRVVFSLAEIDPSFTSTNVIVADLVDGKPLSAAQGPLRIVAPKDAKASRGVRMLERIELRRVPKQP